MKSIIVSERFFFWLKALRVSIGIIYFWFGILKFFPGLSPAEDLAKQTIFLLTFGLIPDQASIIILALWETAIGIFLVVGWKTKMITWIVLIHMFCTFLPLFLLPEISFTRLPYALTLVGQYIIKNLVIISALFVISSFENSST